MYKRPALVACFALLLAFLCLPAVHAQDVQPFRVEAGLAALDPTLSFECVLPLGRVSLGFELGLCSYIDTWGGEATLRFYPLSVAGRGLNIELAYALMDQYQFSDLRNTWEAAVAYRFIFWRNVTVNLGLGYCWLAQWDYEDSMIDYTNSGVSFRFGIGFAF